MKNVIKLDISLKVTQRPNLFYPGEHCVTCQIFTMSENADNFTGHT